MLKALKDHIKEALKKLAQGQVHKGALSKALHEALSGAGFSDSDINDFFDDSEIQGLLQDLGEVDADTLKTMDEKLQTQSELSRGRLMELLLSDPKLTLTTVTKNTAVLTPERVVIQSSANTPLSPRQHAARIGFAKYTEIFNKLDPAIREEHLKTGYSPENAAVDYYEITQRQIALAALWKGFTGKEVSAYEHGVVGDFAVGLAIDVGLAGGAAGVQKVFGTVVKAVIKGIPGKSRMGASELTKKSGNQFGLKDSVWRKGPLERGEIIEKNLGQNLPQNFPVVDKFTPKTGTVTSIKSLDLNAKTYQDPQKLKQTLEKYVDKLADFKGYVSKEMPIKLTDIKQRVLDIAIPSSGNPSQQKILHDILGYAKNKGIEFNAIIYK